ncbi:hypothetical protein [Streptomyces sp. NBC_01304]|uniref:hypothetical protein n=1 Tax=Streptomyces sp. NBC_01304 TaxID=2903818 RepID=UPI002E0FF088|nr:hypothetical protein OG430_26010 [Streptomyces sp. NBC_01304]
MTDTHMEAVVAPAATDPPTPQPVDTAGTKTEVEHTPGGWPVVPLAFSGANSTVSMVAAAGLAGGPIAAAVAATGAVVLGTVASHRSRNPRPKRAARRTAARTAGRQHAALHRSSGLTPAARSAGSAGRRTAGGAGRMPGQTRGRGSAGNGRSAAGLGRHGAGKHRSGTASLNKPAGLKSGRSSLAGAAGRVGQVKALRAGQKAAGGTRGQKRAQTAAARRAVADARRNTPKLNKPQTSGNKRAGLGKARSQPGGLTGRMLGGAAVRRVRCEM